MFRGEDRNVTDDSTDANEEELSDLDNVESLELLSSFLLRLLLLVTDLVSSFSISDSTFLFLSLEFDCGRCLTLDLSATENT